MKKTITLIVLSFVTVWALPKVHVIATGGTIAGTSSGSGYEAGQVTIELLRFRTAQSQKDAFKYLRNGEVMIQAGNKTYNTLGVEQ